jgi:hypothetical protein
MKNSLRAFALSLAIASPCLLTTGCSPKAASTGLRSCFDTGSSVVCVATAALSTTSTDVNGDGKPDVFVCADDDGDSHDRSRDRDRSGCTTANPSADEDADGVVDDLDCGHRNECHALTNEVEKSGHDGVGDDSAKSSLYYGATAGSSGGEAESDASGHHGSSGGGATSGAGGSDGESHGGAGAGGNGDDHGGAAGQGGGSDDRKGGSDRKDEHPQTGCQPPPLTPPVTTPVPGL